MLLTEFFNGDHFRKKYKYFIPTGDAASFIECFWETDFGPGEGKNEFIFSDCILPSVGTTILLNLGTPYLLEIGREQLTIDRDVWYSRLATVRSTHFSGNRIFAIRMQSNIFIGQSIYNYLGTGKVFNVENVLDKLIIQRIKETGSFEKRCEIVLEYLLARISRKQITAHAATSIQEAIFSFNSLLKDRLSVSDVSKEVNCTTKTLGRYFEKYVGAGPKKCFRILRFRKAIEHYAVNASTFSIYDYGYFDYSHFYREVKDFTGCNLGGLKNNKMAGELPEFQEQSI
jgi:AraC-like DNA-binding protein